MVVYFMVAYGSLFRREKLYKKVRLTFYDINWEHLIILIILLRIF